MSRSHASRQIVFNLQGLKTAFSGLAIAAAEARRAIADRSSPKDPTP
jgi:hypothetical protein